uniref:Uncharacterized protein n=1 Tax=Oryza rufipogon TaxID=4529 RepID=A0A0E0QFW6_ORYRU
MRRPHGVANLVGRIAAAAGGDAEVVAGGLAYEPEVYAPMMEEEALSFSSAWGVSVLLRVCVIFFKTVTN